MSHAECLRLQGMPRPPTHHSLVGEVGDGIDTLPSDVGRSLMRQREEEQPLKGSESLVREVVVQCDAGAWRGVRLRRGGRGWAEE